MIVSGIGILRKAQPLSPTTFSSVEWSAQFLADGQGTLVVKAIVSTLFRTGLESLKSRLGAAK
jgi:hypothetical protein